MNDKHMINMKVAMVATMVVRLAFGAASYEVAGPDVSKPHERTAMEELSSYLGKRVSGTVRVGGKEGIVFRVGDTALAQREGLLSTDCSPRSCLPRSGSCAPSATRCC